MKYRPEIDGLRALAVLPVILFHAGFESFSGGFVGVDVFFVISGYLITTIIIKELDEGDFSIASFYERRARRILPALFFVMLLCIPFAWFWLSPSDLESFGKSLIAVSTFSSNVLFWKESGYFDTATELKPLLHTWSLAVEEQYYILFPIFLILTWKFGIRFILSTLAITFIVSLGLAQWGSIRYPSPTFYLLPTRGWELLIGVFIAFYLNYRSYLNSNIMNQLLSIIGFGMVVYSIIYFNEETPFPSIYALIPTIGTGFLIISTVPNTLIYRLFTIPPIVSIGLLSYSAYLWHQPILSFSRHRLLGEVSELLLLGLCFCSLIMAYISWRFIEKPFRDRKITSKKFIFAFSLFGMFAFSILGIKLVSNDGFNNRVNFSDRLIDSFDRPEVSDCYDLINSHFADDWGCYLGKDKKGVDYILFGDSHSISLKFLIERLAKKKNLRIFYSGASGCLPFIDIFPKRDDQYERNCNLLNKRISKFAHQNNVKGVILSARWSYYTTGNYDGSGLQYISEFDNGPFSREGSILSFEKGFNKTVNLYNDMKIPLHIISQPPQQKYPPESAYFFIEKGMGNIYEMSIDKSLYENLESIPLDIIRSRESEIYFYHTIDFFCDEKKCPIGSNEESFYYDEDHLSKAGSQKLTTIIETILKQEN